MPVVLRKPDKNEVSDRVSVAQATSNSLWDRLDKIKEYTDGVKDLFHPKAKVAFSPCLYCVTVIIFNMGTVRLSKSQRKSASGLRMSAPITFHFLLMFAHNSFSSHICP
jgi:hypothetical protein